MEVGVVIVAAGSGTRFGGPVRKTLVPLAGLPLFVHAARTFARVAAVGAGVVVAHREDLALVDSAIASDPILRGRFGPAVPGGARRQDSVAAGIDALPALVRRVLVHDAARPLVEAERIEALIAALDAAEAALLAVPVTSTLKRSDGEGRVAATLPRDGLYLATTPQGARRDLLAAALRSAALSGVEVTDEAAALERQGVQPRIVPDSAFNVKVTAPGDLRFAEAVLRAREGEAGAT